MAKSLDQIIVGVLGARSQPIRLQQGLRQDGQANDVEATWLVKSDGPVGPEDHGRARESIVQPRLSLHSFDSGVSASYVNFESVNPFEALANNPGAAASNEEDLAREEVETEAIEDNDDDIPPLPVRDEYGRLIDKRGPEKAEKERREREDVDVGDVGGEARSSNEEEIGRRARVRAGPGEPTKAERDRHNTTHVPYQSWCKFCVKGRGRRTAHRRSARMDSSSVPVIVFDYHFMADEDRAAARNPMIGMRDLKTGNRYMRAVGQKGLGNSTEMDWLIRDMNEELKSWGYAGGAEDRLVFRTDDESSLMAVTKKLAKFHGGEVVPEHSPPGESQANGAAEENGKSVLGLAVTMLEQVCANVEEVIDGSLPFVQWVIRWAAMVLSRYAVIDGEKTAYERQTGRKCNLEVIPIGETVLYRSAKTSDDRKRVLGENWREAIWLGHNRGSSDSLVGTASGVVRAWSVKRVSESDRWNLAMLKAMRGVPGQPDPSQQGVRIPVSITMPIAAPMPMVRVPEEKGRQIYFKDSDFEEHGYTDGCEGCDARKAGMPLRRHSDVCRARLTAELRKARNPRYLKARERGGVEPTEPEPTEPEEVRESPAAEAQEEEREEEKEGENTEVQEEEREREEAREREIMLISMLIGQYPRLVKWTRN